MKFLFTIFTLLFSGVVSAVGLNNIVVFGDSLSDNGNLYEYMGHKIPQSPPYFRGHFSNGRIWVERLAESYFPKTANAHLHDYAYGGAGVSDEESDVLMTLKRELDIYLNAHQGNADENSLYIVWIGANNYISLPQEVEETLSEVNKGIVGGLKRLADAGAKNILVVNVPDLGKSPFATASGATKELSHFCQRHHELLFNAVNELKQIYPDVKWMYFDVKEETDKLLNSPQSYGFTNVTDTCYSVKFDKGLGNSVMSLTADVKIKPKTELCRGYFFFDPIHPTASAHKLLAIYARALLDSEGIEFANSY